MNREISMQIFLPKSPGNQASQYDKQDSECSSSVAFKGKLQLSINCADNFPFNSLYQTFCCDEPLGYSHFLQGMQEARQP